MKRQSTVNTISVAIALVESISAQSSPFSRGELEGVVALN
ncbi:hypothetical protein THOG05_150038 [Vibrio rotiferianus]|nr:hypothetical protein THOG05_150038 [Vibrio rotiferianus]